MLPCSGLSIQMSSCCRFENELRHVTAVLHASQLEREQQAQVLRATQLERESFRQRCELLIKDKIQ